MKLFTVVTIVAIAFSATVFAAANSKIFRSTTTEQLASLSPSGGVIGKYTMPAANPAATVAIQSFADASRPDVSKIAEKCQNQAAAKTKNGIATAASQNVYYDCLQAGLKTDMSPAVE